jgi:D-alanyl-D-alanine carboxypeptidase (penicillin-binding protein 5/6)
MDERYTSVFTEEERAARRRQRQEARKARLRARRRRQLMLLLPCMLVSVLVAGLLLGSKAASQEEDEDAGIDLAAQTPVVPQQPQVEEPEMIDYTATADTVQLGAEFPSSYAVLIDLDSHEILAEKGADTVIYPASMTKVLTVLVAAEAIEESDLDQTFAMTREITDYCYVNGCSVVGLMVDETVTVRELFYGTILPSGADAAVGLATYVAGSHEAFVDMMNDKLEELGLSDTAHFTNCVGLFDENHACTVSDMAVILEAALDNDLCREVLGAHTYETAPTTDHPEGQILSNWFLRRIEDKDTGSLTVMGAKTGYVVESGSCAASWAQDTDGHRYLCVTADASSSWQAIYDHADLYKTYCAEAEFLSSAAEEAASQDGTSLSLGEAA